MKNRFAAMAMAMLLLLSLPLAVRGKAAETQTCTLTVHMIWKDTALTGGSLSLCRVGSAENGEFQFLPELADCAPEPEALARKAAENKLPAAIATVRNGVARFAGLEAGLYLVTQKEPCTGYSPIKPFLLSLPVEENGRLLYDISASPKVSPEPENTDPSLPTVGPDETVPETTVPPATVPPGIEPTLPQTGQLNWPVPVMAVAGTLLLGLGCWLYFGKKEEYES